MVDDLLGALIRIVTDDLDLNLRSGEIDGETPLLDEGLALDSIVVIEFIGMIERKFGITFPDSLLTVDSFRDLNTLAARLGGLIDAGHARTNRIKGALKA